MVYCKIKKRLLKTRASKINHMSCYSFSVLYIVFVTHLRTRRMSLKDKTASKIVIKTSLSCKHKIHSLPSLTSLICIIISCNLQLSIVLRVPVSLDVCLFKRSAHFASRNLLRQYIRQVCSEGASRHKSIYMTWLMGVKRFLTSLA